MVHLDINLLPPKRRALSKEQRNLLTGLIFFLLILVLIYFGLNSMVQYTKSELNEVSEELQAFAPLEKEINELNTLEKQIKDQEQYISGLLGKLNDWYLFMGDFSRHIPTRVTMSTIRVGADGSVTLIGNAPSLLDVSRFYVSLGYSTSIEGATIVSVTPQEGSWSFEFSSKLRKVTP